MNADTRRRLERLEQRASVTDGSASYRIVLIGEGEALPPDVIPAEPRLIIVEFVSARASAA